MTIIAATDFAAASRAITDVAAELARRRGEDLIVAHVVDGPLLPGMYDGLRVEAEARRLASAFGCHARPQLLHDGNVGKRLGELAERERATLLVVGAQGEGMRSGIGSVAAAALRHAPCPLLVVRDAQRLWARRDGGALRALVSIALDDTDATLREALSLVAATGDFHADFVHYQLMPSEPLRDRVEARAIGEREVREQLGGLPAGLALGAVVVRDGRYDIARDLCDFVTGRGADLVVCGSHHRRGLERAFDGSTAEQIVSHAPVSVLVGRAPIAAATRGLAFAAANQNDERAG